MVDLLSRSSSESRVQYWSHLSSRAGLYLERTGALCQALRTAELLIEWERSTYTDPSG